MFPCLTSCCQNLEERLMEKESLLVRSCFWYSWLRYKNSESIKDSFLVKQQGSLTRAVLLIALSLSYCFFSRLSSPSTPTLKKMPNHPSSSSFQGDGWFIILAYVLLLCMINLMESKWWAPYAAAVLSRVGRLIYHCTLSQGGHLLLIHMAGRDVNS